MHTLDHWIDALEFTQEHTMTQTAKINHHVEIPDSSAISSLGYDPATAVLEVDWNDAKTGEIKRYRYYGVDATTYAELLNSKSAGAYVNESIKGRFPVRRQPITVRKVG